MLESVVPGGSVGNDNLRVGVGTRRTVGIIKVNFPWLVLSQISGSVPAPSVGIPISCRSRPPDDGL